MASLVPLIFSTLNSTSHSHRFNMLVHLNFIFTMRLSELSIRLFFSFSIDVLFATKAMQNSFSSSRESKFARKFSFGGTSQKNICTLHFSNCSFHDDNDGVLSFSCESNASELIRLQQRHEYSISIAL